MPGKILMADHESELRMKEQAAKDASGDKKTFDDRAKDMNNSWNQSDYNKKFLQASNIRSGFDRAFADKSGLGTAQLVLDWYKLNDPGSVVSQNEMNSLSTKTQSMPEGLISAVNQALAGGGMSDDTKIKLLKNMDGKYQDQRQTYEKQRDNQRSLAGKIGGIDPTMVIRTWLSCTVLGRAPPKSLLSRPLLPLLAVTLPLVAVLVLVHRQFLPASSVVLHRVACPSSAAPAIPASRICPRARNSSSTALCTSRTN